MNHILLAEDDANLSALLCAYLARDGFDVRAAADGLEALRAFRAMRPALVLLDIMLPGVDGWEVCRQIRRDGDVPVIMLTARIDEADRIAGLRLGADDYVVKPFSPIEVVERVKAVLRRSGGGRSCADASGQLRQNGLTLSPETFTVSMDGAPVSLTLSEFRILEALMRAPGRVFSRDHLLDVLGRDDGAVIDRAVDVHILNLRRKLNDGEGPHRLIETVRGVGYRLRGGPGS